MNMKVISFIVTIVIIVLGIVSYNSGDNPSWFMFFLGWVFVAYHELREML